MLRYAAATPSLTLTGTEAGTDAAERLHDGSLHWLMDRRRRAGPKEAGEGRERGWPLVAAREDSPHAACMEAEENCQQGITGRKLV